MMIIISPMTNVRIPAPVLLGQIETVTGQSDCKDNKSPGLSVSLGLSPGLVSSNITISFSQLSVLLLAT